jgi:hypothetical protein
MSHPFRQRDVLVFVALKHLEKYQAGAACILDEMRFGNRDLTDIPFFKVHRAGGGACGENRHAALASGVVLPLIGIGGLGTGATSQMSDPQGWEWRSWDQAPVTLPRRRTIGVLRRVTGHANARKLVAVGVRSCESVSECFEECNDLVLLAIGEAEIAGGHIDIVVDLGHWPAVHFFDRSCRAVSGSDVVHEFFLVTRIVEVYKLLQALDVAIVKEPLLEVRRGAGLGGRTLLGCHGYIARRRHLELTVDSWCKLCPIRVRIGRGNASEETSHSQISKGEAVGIRCEAEGIRRVLTAPSDR